MNVIFGCSDFAEKLAYLLIQTGVSVDAFTADKDYFDYEKKNSIPVIPYEELREKSLDVNLYLAVGYRRMNRGREEIYQRAKRDGFQIASFIHPSAVVSTEKMGEGNLIFEQAVVGPYAELGHCNVCYPKALIAHHTKVGSFNFFAISSSVAGHVRVGNRCFFGNNCCTREGIAVADETLVGAGAYVSKDTEVSDCIVPAQSITLGEKSCELI